MKYYRDSIGHIWIIGPDIFNIYDVKFGKLDKIPIERWYGEKDIKEYGLISITEEEAFIEIL